MSFRLSTLFVIISVLLGACNTANLDPVRETSILTITPDVSPTQIEMARLLTPRVPESSRHTPPEQMEYIPELDEHFKLCNMLSGYHVDFFSDPERSGYLLGHPFRTLYSKYICGYSGASYKLQTSLFWFPTKGGASKAMQDVRHTMWVEGDIALVSSSPRGFWGPVTEKGGASLYHQDANVLLVFNIKPGYGTEGFPAPVVEWQPEVESLVETLLSNLRAQTRPLIREPDPDSPYCTLLRREEIEQLTGPLVESPSNESPCIHEGEFNSLYIFIHWLPTIKEADSHNWFWLHAGRLWGPPARIPYGISIWKEHRFGAGGILQFQYSNMVLKMYTLVDLDQDNYLNTPDNAQEIMEELAVLLVERLPEMPAE